jgi:hypothetical protein
VLAVALVLDREGDPAPPAVKFTAADVARITTRVEELRGLKFQRPVRPLFLDRDAAVALAARISRSEYSESEQRADEEGLKLLGLLRPKADLRAAVDSVGEEQVLGFYDDRSKRLVVIRDPGVTRPLLEITLAHELVHALEDQRFGLNVPDGVPDDVALAESALAEGTATALMIDYAKRYMKLSDVLQLASQSGGESLPPFLEKLLLFPYLEGEKFVTEFRGERGSWGPIDAMYRFRRPQSSEQVLHPRRYALGERAERVPAPPLAGALGPGWRRLRATSLGEYDLRLLFDLVGGTRPAAGAEGWAGGRYELWRGGRPGENEDCAAPCVARDVAFLRVRWDTQRDRIEAEKQLVRVWEQGLHGTRPAGHAEVSTWFSRGGAIVMEGRGRETTAVLAPDARLAARVLIRAR